jgi:hypothetical protein
MATLIPEAELQRACEKYEREHPVPPTHAERLCELARANLDAKVKDLAFAADRSPGWVRRILRLNGIVLLKPAKKRRVKVKSNTLCGMCGHPRGGPRARGLGLPSHCTPGTTHGHWSNPAAYVCDKRHCLAFNFVDGKQVACGCPDFVAPQAEQNAEVNP